MKFLLLTASILAAAALPVAAQAQDAPRGYVSLGYNQLETDQATLGAVTGRAGWKVRPWIGLEAEASVGVEDQTFDASIGGAGGAIELKHDIAAYGVAFLPLGQNFELFARVGYGSTRIRSTAAGVSVQGDGESFNYGLGAAAFHRADGLRIDWTRRDYTGDDDAADSWTLSYIRRF